MVASGLADYAAVHGKRPGPQCTVCTLFAARPELAFEIKKARAQDQPTSFQVISNYLRDKHGLSIGTAGLKHHYAQNHKESA